MLESLINFREINDRPYLMGIWAFIICSIAILISLQIPLAIPGTNSGFLAVMFSIIPAVYFITSLIKKEEVLEESFVDHQYVKKFWFRHEKDIMILLFFFGGMTLAFAIWSIFLPMDFFQAQVSKINEIQGVTGQTVTIAATQFESFTKVFTNNLQVMFFAFLFSFIFGAGAIFIIAWNASVLGVYIGQLSKVLWQIPIVSLSFLPHGIPEIAGYLCAGLAGGLISAAIIRKNSTHMLKIIAFDSMKILALGVLLILGGAGIEAFLS